MNRSSATLLVLGEGRRNDTLAHELALDGYEPRRAEDARVIQTRCADREIHLLILGAGRDQGARLDLLRSLRAGAFTPQVAPDTRSLWVAMSDEVSEVLRAFQAGADDVLRVPWEYPELLARVGALLRRQPIDAAPLIEFGALRIDTEAYQATFGSTPIQLRRMEYELLVHLARLPHRVHAKEELLRDVWGYRATGSTRTLDSHVSRVRRALEQAGAEGLIVTVWGVGYRLAPERRIELRVLSGGSGPSSSRRGRALPMVARIRVRRGGTTARTTRAGTRQGEAMNTLTGPRPQRHRHDVPGARTRHAPSRLGHYTDPDSGAVREILRVPGAGGSTLVVDRLTGTHGDPRVIAHLASDEPQENAGLLCSLYLADESRGRCGALTAEDLRAAPVGESPANVDLRLSPDTALLDDAGVSYRIRAIGADGSFPQLRWTRSVHTGEDEPGEPISLREVVARLQNYEPATAMTRVVIAAHLAGREVSTYCLRSELGRLSASPIVLNRRLRELVSQSVSRGGLTMSEIAMRCGRVKRDSRGNISGETSWLARRIGQLPEGGQSEPTPWISTDVLALIAREGLGVSPREVELAC